MLVRGILEHDREAIGARAVYDEAYFAGFFSSAGPVLERRLGDAISSVAAMVAGAREAAGRPPVPVDLPPGPPQRRRR